MNQNVVGDIVVIAGSNDQRDAHQTDQIACNRANDDVGNVSDLVVFKYVSIFTRLVNSIEMLLKPTSRRNATFRDDTVAELPVKGIEYTHVQNRGDDYRHG